MPDSTIQQDVQNTDQPLVDMDAIANAFGELDSDDDFGDEDENSYAPDQDDRFSQEYEEDLSDPDEEEDEDDTGDEEDEEGEEADNEDGSDDDFEEIEVSDDFVIPVKVNGEDVEVTVADLKRLAGQEAAITQKAQQVSEMRRNVEKADQLAKASYEKLLERTNARLKPYEGIDFVQLARNPNITDQQLKEIQEEHRTLMEEKSFLEEGIKTHVESLQNYQQEAMLAKAQENISVIEDQASPYYIPDFRTRYYELKQHAIKQGADEEFINNLIDPWTWKLINDSLRLNTTVTKAEKKKAEKLPRSSAKRVKRTRGSNRAATGRAASRQQAIRKLKANPGSERAVLDAFGALDD